MRFDLINYLFNFIGSPYAWGKEGPSKLGFDCSGLMLEGLRSIGKWGKDDASSQGIFNKFEPSNSLITLGKADCGCLLFFGKDKKSITHIGLAINNYQYIEAGGGDSKTVDKGMVRIRPLSWRKDLVAVIDIFKE
ncbi:MAG: C40 family peptidase [Nitrosomonas sp.]|nr:C40 family peptidase [Nitrosomonas sp.]